MARMTIAGLLTSALLLPIATNAFVSLPVYRNGPGNPPLGPRNRVLPPLSKRDSWEQTIINNRTGGGYFVDVTVGTPPQPQRLILDTGSSDVWVLNVDSDYCNSRQLQYESGYGGCLATYDPSASSTFKVVDGGGFEIKYLDGSSAKGDYITETLSIAGTNITALQMGLANDSAINTGLVGVSFSSAVAAARPYPNIIEELQTQGKTKTQAYSLWLNDLDSDSGSILFGAIDTEKFIGELTRIPMLPSINGEYMAFAVGMTRLEVTSPSDAFSNTTITSDPLPVILDSGTTLSYLPTSVLDDLYTQLTAYDDTASTGLVYVSCGVLALDMLFSFTFATNHTANPTVTINVPVRDMVWDILGPYIDAGLRLPPQRELGFDPDDACMLGLHPIDGDGITSGSGVDLSSLGLLGDTFLRSAYVVYDLDNKEVGIARANLNATGSNVVEITSTIPDATGVASQVPYNPTGTGQDGVLTVTSTAVSKNSAAGVVPAFRWEGVVVMGLAAFWALVGSAAAIL